MVEVSSAWKSHKSVCRYRTSGVQECSGLSPLQGKPTSFSWLKVSWYTGFRCFSITMPWHGDLCTQENFNLHRSASPTAVFQHLSSAKQRQLGWEENSCYSRSQFRKAFSLTSNISICKAVSGEGIQHLQSTQQKSKLFIIFHSSFLVKENTCRTTVITFLLQKYSSLEMVPTWRRNASDFFSRLLGTWDLFITSYTWM